MANETTLNDIMEAIVGLNQKMDSGFNRLDKKIDANHDEMNVRFQEQNMRLDLIESKLDQVGTNRILLLEREVEVMKANLKKVANAIEQLQEAK